MTIALDTNVLVRLLVADDAAQHAKAKRLIERAEAAGDPVFILFGVMLETEWVLRSRYRRSKAALLHVFTQLLESASVVHEDEQALEEALSLWKDLPKADFADCMLVARANQLGLASFATFDTLAADLPNVELIK